MSKPSPFEPGYVPPPGAKLPPPSKPESFMPARSPEMNMQHPSREPAAQVFIPVEKNLIHPETSKIKNARQKKSRPIALIATVALVVGIGPGFGLGYIAASEEGSPEQVAEGSSSAPSPRDNSPTTTPTPTPEHTPTVSPEPDPTPVEKLEEMWLSGSTEGVGLAPFLLESPIYEWDESIAIGAWVVSATQPRDVSADLLIFDDNNKPAPDGVSYQMSELTATYVGPTQGDPAESFSAFYSSGDDAFNFQHCGKIPHDIRTSDKLQPGESLIANICIPVKNDTEGLWFMTFDRANWFGLT